MKLFLLAIVFEDLPRTAWQWDGFFNYLLLHPESDPDEFEAKIPAFVQETIGEDLERFNSGVIFHLQPLKSIHLHSDFMSEAEPNGNATTVYALLVVAFFLVTPAAPCAGYYAHNSQFAGVGNGPCESSRIDPLRIELIAMHPLLTFL